MKIVLLVVLVMILGPIILAPLFILAAVAIPNFILPAGSPALWPHNTHGIGMDIWAIVLPYLVAILAIFILYRLGMAMLRGSDKKEGVLNSNETQIIQEIHQGLSRLDERVEHLETILIAGSRRRERESKWEELERESR